MEVLAVIGLLAIVLFVLRELASIAKSLNEGNPKRNQEIDRPRKEPKQLED